MKQFIKVLPIALLTVMGSVMAADTVGRTFFLGNEGRTISNGVIANAGRTHLPDQDAFNGVFSVQQHYSQNFNQNKIGNYLFFNGTNSMIVRGTVNAAALPTDIFAPNLSIGGVTYNSTITVNPSVSAATTDLRLAVGLDEFVQGLHFNVSLPIVWTKWDAKLTETVTTAAGVFANETVNWFSNAGGEASTYANAVAAFRGNLTTTPGAGGTTVSETMNYGKLDGSRSETSVGNTVVELGYDFICRDNAHLAVGLHGLFNGGAKSDAVYMFEPSIGTAGRHGVGATVDGHLRLYEGETDDVHFTGYLNAQITHLFDATMRRSYDSTRHGVGSRYKMVKVGQTIAFVAANSHNANYINYSSLRAKIGIDVMYDATLMVRYQNGGLCCDLGYQAWGHSAEKHKGWVDTYTTSILGAIAATTQTADWANANIARISLDASITGTQPGGTTAATGVAATATNVLSLADLNINSGLNPSAMTNTVFGNIGYEWLDSDWRPFIGAGAAGEFANNNTAFDQWHVFVNGGVSF